MRGQFAEKHRASLGQGLCNGGIGLRDVIGKRPRMRRGSDSLGFDDVLKRDWNAVERPAPITCRYGPFGGAGVGERALGRDRDERMKPGLQLHDPIEMELGELDR